MSWYVDRTMICFKVATITNPKRQTPHLFTHMQTFLKLGFIEVEIRNGRREYGETQLTKHTHMGRLRSDALHHDGMTVIDSYLLCIQWRTRNLDALNLKGTTPVWGEMLTCPWHIEYMYWTVTLPPLICSIIMPKLKKKTEKCGTASFLSLCVHNENIVILCNL